jgi:hypothetical protein
VIDTARDALERRVCREGAARSELTPSTHPLGGIELGALRKLKREAQFALRRHRSIGPLAVALRSDAAIRGETRGDPAGSFPIPFPIASLPLILPYPSVALGHPEHPEREAHGESNSK